MFKIVLKYSVLIENVRYRQANQETVAIEIFLLLTVPKRKGHACLRGQHGEALGQSGDKRGENCGLAPLW